MAQPQKQPLHVYYDKNCPVCTRFIVSVNKSTKKENFQCKPMQNLEGNDLLSKEFHVITADGKVYRKFDGILKIGEMYPKWRFFVSLSRLPIIYQLLSFGYDIFAAHRFGISKLFDRLLLTKIVLILVLFTSFILSYPLWLSERLYPQIPVAPFLPTIPFPIDYIIFMVMLSLLVVSLLNITSRKYLITFSIILGIFFLLDQSRLQPEFYQFFLLTVAVSMFPWSGKESSVKSVMISTCCFIIASIYIYSGLQKANISFITGIFPWFVQPVIQLVPPIAANVILRFGILIPLIETGIGIGLLTKRFRMPALIGAICMHLFILFSLGPFGHNWNSVVWPWNIAMCCFVVILFWDNTSFAFTSVFRSIQPVSIILIILCGVLPAFSFFNEWDSYLSASLYSGNIETAQIHISKNTLNLIDPRFAKYIVPYGKSDSILDISSWSYEEMNVPSYPQDRIFKGITRSICKNVPDTSTIEVVIKSKPNWLTGISSATDYTCNDLML